MKRLAFPTLFTFVLLGLWIFSRAQGGAAPSSTTPPPSTSQGKQSAKTTKPAPKPDELTDKEEMFAATLSPKNEEVFSGWMNKKQRTMAMEMVIENHRSGGSLTPDQIVEQLSKDFNLVAPPPPPRPAVEAPAPKTTPAQPAPMQQAPAPSYPATPHSTNPPPTNTEPAHPAPMNPETSPASPAPQTPESQAGTTASPPKPTAW